MGGVYFSQSPFIKSSSSNITTTDSFNCRFTPLGNGSLIANVTWFVDGSPWHYNDQSFAVLSGFEANSSWINPENTTKHQHWICQVTLDNSSSINVSNSSSVEVLNTLPTILDPAQLIFYEDLPASFFMSASDPDNDSFQWFSNDLSKSNFGNVELFDISVNGLVNISHFDESLVGNHTMQIVVYDEPGVGSVRNFEFQLIAVNDLPIYDSSTLSYSCVEGSVCSGQVIANDQDNSSSQLVYAFNETFINWSSDGSFSFIPTYTQAVKENFSIDINVTDGINFSFDVLHLNISSTNHAPNVSYVNVSATQNDSSFVFYFNVTDYLDPQDIFFFNIYTNCSNSVWSLQNISNGSNSTTAVGLINTSLFGNEYVECRDVTIVVDEYDESSMLLKTNYSYSLTFNISNINDAPIIHEISNSNVQKNISNQSGAIGLSYSYLPNVTDSDMLTYQGDTLHYYLIGVPTFVDGSPKFTINHDSGLISSVQSSMNSSYIGNYTFTLFVNDSLSPTLSDSKNISLTIVYNFPPVINSINSSDCLDSFSCLKNISASDREHSKSYLHLLNLSYTNPLNVSKNNYSESEIANLLGINLSGSFVGNTTSYWINFTPDDSNLGFYVLNFSFSDDVGNVNYSNLSFNVNNTPQYPFFDNDSDHSVLDNISFDIFAETIPFSKYIYFYDSDLYYGLDDLNFSFVFVNGSLDNFSIVKLNNSVALLNYTSSNVTSGNYTLNLTLVDSYNLSTSSLVDFVIHDTSEFPLITSIKPFVNNSNNWLNISEETNRINISIAENTTVDFNIVVQDDDNLSMNVSWFVDGVFNSSSIYNSSNPQSDLNYYFSFFSNGTHNISVKVSDIGFDTFSWIVNVSNVNRPPINSHPLDNLTGVAAIRGSGGVFFANFFKLYWDSKIVFYDADDDLNSDFEISDSETNNLLFSINTSGGCDELASFVFTPGTDDVTVTPIASGSCLTNFIAIDPFNRSVTSNDVELEIIKTQSNSGSSTGTKTVTVTQSVTVPLEVDVDVPSTFHLLFPGVVAIYKNGSVRVPLSLVNTWNKDLVGISLFINDTLNNLTYHFDKDYFDNIPRGSSVNTSLVLYGYRVDAPFQFNVSVRIASLGNFVDDATIYVNALEKGKDDLEAINSRITFARDLLSDNPECSELVGVLDSAASDPNSTSLELINNVIGGCKYLMSSGNNRSNSLPKSFSGRLALYSKSVVNYNLLLIIFVSFLGGSIVLFVLSRFFLKKI